VHIQIIRNSYFLYILTHNLIEINRLIINFATFFTTHKHVLESRVIFLYIFVFYRRHVLINNTTQFQTQSQLEKKHFFCHKIKHVEDSLLVSSYILL